MGNFRIIQLQRKAFEAHRDKVRCHFTPARATAGISASSALVPSGSSHSASLIDYQHFHILEDDSINLFQNSSKCIVKTSN
jgi:hypothetical protein